jgi:hypothetical protein
MSDGTSIGGIQCMSDGTELPHRWHTLYICQMEHPHRWHTLYVRWNIAPTEIAYTVCQMEYSSHRGGIYICQMEHSSSYCRWHILYVGRARISVEDPDVTYPYMSGRYVSWMEHTSHHKSGRYLSDGTYLPTWMVIISDR